jgi:hypothetical protein
MVARLSALRAGRILPPGLFFKVPGTHFCRWKNYYYQLLNVHGVSDVWQIEIHIAEPLVADPSLFEVEIAIAKLKRYKSPGSDQIPAEPIQAGGETLWSEIHKFINFIWSKEELPDDWKKSIIVPVHKKVNETD